MYVLICITVFPQKNAGVFIKFKGPADNHAAETACQTTTVTDVTVIQDGDLSILA